LINPHSAACANGLCAPVIDKWEADYYRHEADRESAAFAALAKQECGPGPWRKFGDWMLARTCASKSAARVFNAEASFLVLFVQAWVSRVSTSEHLATDSDSRYIDQCVRLIVQALRSVAPDAVRKAMRYDA
jgi:hypothetical protein